jgi:hypothetical protein
MAQTDFIPAGRTSRIVRGSNELQIQTEYAYRPNPRLTTSVISRGQVIQKIQQDLDSPISSFEEKARAEELLRKQHMEVLNIMSTRNLETDLTGRGKPTLEAETLSVVDKLSKVEGVEKVYRIDNSGNFDTENLSKEFRERFSSVFKSLFEVLEIFSQLPGGRREKGICEIDHNRLYLVSNGHECFFLLTRRMPGPAGLGERIQAVLEK